ncbi:uncharacterized protein LOC141677438 isoform X2 [Apium graveolens]|uniref:uncharacterized protein LOC141677438 isoform X2 n=1 Tax=Apium graveolens TaxID=4045 RepID=UPI003D7B8EB8
MPEDPQESKYRSVPIGDSVKMPEDPHLQQEEEFSFPTKRDPLDGFVFSQQRRMEGLQRFMKKRKLRAIPECSEISSDEDGHQSPKYAPMDSSSVTAPATDRLIVDEMEVYEDDDDDEVTYPCPYCHAEFELLHLCDHLEEEHYDDDTAAAVCSICKHNIRGDMLRHITTEHEALFKISFTMNISNCFFSFFLCT